MSYPSIDLIRPQILEIVKETGAFIREEAKNFQQSKVEVKGLNDLVSYVDQTAEKMLKAGFRELLPGAGYINEEGEDEKGENGWRWIIDPLDGTTNFVYGVPVYSISVALQWEEETIFGVVYEINRSELFMAEKGKGATMNGARIEVGKRKNLAESLIATGFPYNTFGRLPDVLAVLGKFRENCRGIRRFGSAAVDLAWVACGRFDGFYENTLNAWDVAAGILLVEEAGGAVRDYSGGRNALFGRQIAAANPVVLQEMLELLKPLS